MLNLGKVGIRIAIVHQGVEEFGGFPDRLLPLPQAEVLLFLCQHIVDRHVLVVQAVELGDAGSHGCVVLAKLLFAFAFLIAALEELIPLIKILQWLVGNNCGLAHASVSFGYPARAASRVSTLPLTYTNSRRQTIP